MTNPYASNTTTSTTNAAFITQTGANFNGDIASLLATRSLGGGIATGLMDYATNRRHIALHKFILLIPMCLYTHGQ